MGLFDGIVGNVVGSVLGGSPSQQAANPLGALVDSLGGGNRARGGDLLGAVMSMVQKNGGLPGVLDMFRSQGLAREADSWVGTGPNAGVSPQQVQRVFGGSPLGDLAARLGTSQGEATSMLAQILPELVNQLTPEGRVPENHGDLISQGLALLRRGI